MEIIKVSSVILFFFKFIFFFQKEIEIAFKLNSKVNYSFLLKVHSKDYFKLIMKNYLLLIKIFLQL